MVDYTFVICNVEDRQNVLAVYLSRSVGEEAAEENEEDKQVIELFFSKLDKRRLEMAEVTATVESIFDLEKSLRIINILLVSEDGTETPAILRRQANKYQVKGPTCSDASGRD